jgi:hypothetical protein
VHRGRESGLTQIFFQSQNLTSLGRRCNLFTSQCSYYSVCFSIQYLFCFMFQLLVDVLYIINFILCSGMNVQNKYDISDLLV